MCKLNEAKRFLETLDEFASKFTFQTFDDNSERKDTSLCKIHHGKIDDLFDRLTDLNNQGAGIFVTVNETDFKGRKAKNIKAARALYLDDDGDADHYSCDPDIIVKTSNNKRHMYVLLSEEEWSLDEYKKAQNKFVVKYNGDPRAKDIARVLRLPGFFNMKNRPYLVSHKVINSTPRPKSKVLELINYYRDIPAYKKINSDRMDMFDLAIRALEFIPADDYHEWILVGMALKKEFGEHAFDLWCDWSSTSDKYKEIECHKKWRGFS